MMDPKQDSSYDVAEWRRRQSPKPNLGLEMKVARWPPPPSTTAQITEKDEKVLQYLQDVRAEDLTGDETGFKLTFDFAENPYFTNTTLVRSRRRSILWCGAANRDPGS
jgi:Nucleosome assembly protein (NAP)